MDVTEPVRMQQVRVFYGRVSPASATVMVPFLLSCGHCAPQGSLPFGIRARALAQTRPHATSRT